MKNKKKKIHGGGEMSIGDGEKVEVEALARSVVEICAVSPARASVFPPFGQGENACVQLIFSAGWPGLMQVRLLHANSILRMFRSRTDVRCNYVLAEGRWAVLCAIEEREPVVYMNDDLFQKNQCGWISVIITRMVTRGGRCCAQTDRQPTTVVVHRSRSINFASMSGSNFSCGVGAWMVGGNPRVPIDDPSWPVPRRLPPCSSVDSWSRKSWTNEG